MRRKVLITGANGLLGQHLTKLLLTKKNIEVFASGRGKDRLLEKGYNYISLDVSKKSEVDRVITSIQPDIIIHAAAISKVEDCENDNNNAILQNVSATNFLLNAGKSNALKQFIFVSTDFVFSGEKGMLTEEDRRDPPNFYGQTKLLAEDLVMQSWPFKTAIVRTCLVYGQVKDMSRTNIMLWVKNNLKKGNSIKVVNDQYRTPTYVKDLAQGCFLILDQEAEGIYHISGKDYLTPYTIALKVAKELNLPTNLITEVTANTFKENGKRPLKTGFNISKSKNILGYEPISFNKGLEEVVK
ncbi:SDR family oxidoreductase [Flammeovirga kamogawensis]|uniref:dTDP-4-dehydrorhamnose reductase n=1 Tax=Flammeovirga kamogawensis TaxID=373891 RepID=A0ABX8GTV5_9BACT|nr:SDR family oxidoreductase [Flammeovirga kamogawensis]MBB6459958.1 dTDP-4-dehydrorhamnose reductase [Flammeovirga kamogawensis]QWG06991.1 SDR family oxidoreductase [Flammeovirga kamogawensis]TRX68812.1 SDR family oxidoreductase [Flammeovirga kamogawensis]